MNTLGLCEDPGSSAVTLYFLPPLAAKACHSRKEPEPVVLDDCWDLIPRRNQLGIDFYEELG